MTTIGLPKALFYYQHSALWESFFRNLGCEVLVSPDTNKEILDNGVRCCSNDTCLPVKVFHGHVFNLKDKVDFVFVPRYTSLRKKEFTCPKFCGLPDMTFLNLKKELKLLEVSLNLDNSLKESEKSLKELSKRLDISLREVKAGFEGVIKGMKNNCFEQILKHPTRHNERNEVKNIAVLGHNYMLYDSYLSMKLLQKLKSRQINVLTPSDLDYTTRRISTEPFNGREFWEVGLDNLGSAFYFAEKEAVKGIIYITPFACGIDSFVIELIERRIQSQYRIPFLKLTVDEHTGEAGFDTRLEAFLDMI